jgi:hypothetical protein
MKIIFLSLLIFTSCNVIEVVTGKVSKVDPGFNISEDEQSSSLFDGIISFYRFETTNGVNTFDDVFNLNNLTSTTVTDAQALTIGQFGNGMDCEGLRSVSAVFQNASTQNLSFGMTSDFSISFWIRRVAGDPGTGNPFLQFDEFDNLYFQDYVSGGDLYLNITGSSNFYIPGLLNSAGASAWRHIVIRVDRDLGNSTCVDSVCSPSYTGIASNGNSVDPLVLKVCSSFANGELDSLGFWNRLLTDAEVQALNVGVNGLDF